MKSKIYSKIYLLVFGINMYILGFSVALHGPIWLDAIMGVGAGVMLAVVWVRLDEGEDWRRLAEKLTEVAK
jgi:hypothetical protein